MDYTTLITSQHQKPLFRALVDLYCNAVGEQNAVAQSLSVLFDVDTAVGDQLDKIAEWVGCSRRLEVPLDIYFSWDTVGLGWDEGVWRSKFDTGTVATLLSDDVFRNVIKTMIAANHWDGTLTQLQVVLQTLFPNPVINRIKVQDHQNMTVTVIVTGAPLSSIMSAVLQAPPIADIRPSGVAIAGYTLP